MQETISTGVVTAWPGPWDGPTQPTPVSGHKCRDTGVSAVSYF